MCRVQGRTAMLNMQHTCMRQQARSFGCVSKNRGAANNDPDAAYKVRCIRRPRRPSACRCLVRDTDAPVRPLSSIRTPPAWFFPLPNNDCSAYNQRCGVYREEVGSEDHQGKLYFKASPSESCELIAPFSGGIFCTFHLRLRFPSQYHGALGGNVGGIAERVGGPVQNAPGSAGAPRLHRRARSGKKFDTRPTTYMRLNTQLASICTSCLNMYVLAQWTW